jgi:hypothetical protein
LIQRGERLAKKKAKKAKPEEKAEEAKPVEE